MNNSKLVPKKYLPTAVIFIFQLQVKRPKEQEIFAGKKACKSDYYIRVISPLEYFDTFQFSPS